MKKNILIIDDSALMRRVTSDIIDADGRFCIKSTASDGEEGLNLICNNKGAYDAVILDINMPRMDGLQLLKELAKRNIKIRIIVSSTLAKEGARETIAALEYGAFDFITKPEAFTSCVHGSFGELLIEKLLIACNIDTSKAETDEIIKLAYAEKTIERINKRRTITDASNIKKKLVVIAASTGGPKALQRILPLLPDNLDAPIVVVQHMPQGFTAPLAARLNEISDITVVEANDNDILEKGKAYIAKGGYQLILSKTPDLKTKISLAKDETQVLNPCADVTISSICNLAFNDVTCVVLTGMGCDATRGIMKLREYKKVAIYAQNQETSIVYGMPKIIAATGFVDEILPLDKIAEKIINNTGVR